MKHPGFRKAAAVAAAIAVLATGTIATAQSWNRRLFARGTHYYTAYVTAGVPASVVVRGDGDTDLDLYVYDRHRRLVAADDDRSDYCVVRWTPTASGMVTIRVVNLGRVYNNYSIRIWTRALR